MCHAHACASFTDYTDLYLQPANFLSVSRVAETCFESTRRLLSLFLLDSSKMIEMSLSLCHSLPQHCFIYLLCIVCYIFSSTINYCDAFLSICVSKCLSKYYYLDDINILDLLGTINSLIRSLFFLLICCLYASSHSSHLSG